MFEAEGTSECARPPPRPTASPWTDQAARARTPTPAGPASRVRVRAASHANAPSTGPWVALVGGLAPVEGGVVRWLRPAKGARPTCAWRRATALPTRAEARTQRGRSWGAAAAHTGGRVATWRRMGCARRACGRTRSHVGGLESSEISTWQYRVYIAFDTEARSHVAADGVGCASGGGWDARPGVANTAQSRERSREDVRTAVN